MQGLSRVVQDKASVSMHQNLVETTEACITPGYWKMAFLQALVQPTVCSYLWIPSSLQVELSKQLNAVLCSQILNVTCIQLCPATVGQIELFYIIAVQI